MKQPGKACPVTRVYADHRCSGLLSPWLTLHSLRQAMMRAPSGVYCGPLRLLAMEVYDACNAAGTFCNLMTGVHHPLLECSKLYHVQSSRSVPAAAPCPKVLEIWGVRCNATEGCT